MRYRAFLFLSLLIGYPAFVQAQVTANTDEIHRLENGQYSFVKGEVQVTFVDSVSPAFIERQLKLLGYEAINLNIYRVTARIQNEPSMEVLSEIEAHPDIHSIEVSQNSIPESALQEMFERDSLTVEEQKAARKRFESFAQTKDIRVSFPYHINKEEASKILESYPGIDFRISLAPIKSGRIKTKAGKEEEVMESLERLIYVESTAYIGIVDK
jgi:hypothetical protein